MSNEDCCHALLLKGHLRFTDLIKTMLTDLVSTRETPEITLCERILLNIVFIACGRVVAMDKNIDEVPDALEGLVGLCCWTRFGFMGRGSIAAD